LCCLFRPRHIRQIIQRESFRTIEVIIRQFIHRNQHIACRRQRAAIHAMNATATQWTIKQLHHVIDTANAVPPPTLGRLNEPVILLVAESQVKPETMPAAVPHEQSVVFRHLEAVLD